MAKLTPNELQDLSYCKEALEKFISALDKSGFYKPPHDEFQAKQAVKSALNHDELVLAHRGFYSGREREVYLKGDMNDFNVENPESMLLEKRESAHRDSLSCLSDTIKNQEFPSTF